MFDYSSPGSIHVQIKVGETNPREWHAIDEIPIASLQ